MFSFTHRLLIAAAAAIVTLSAAAQEDSERVVYDNDQLRDEITALGVAHNLAFAPSFSTDPFIGLNAGNITYGANLGLKYMPAEFYAPDSQGWLPNADDECSLSFTINGADEKTRQDYLGIIIDYEDDFEWSDYLGSPYVYHAHTDVKVGVYRRGELLEGTVEIPVGKHVLRWKAETLSTPLLDFPPWHILLAEAIEQLSKKIAVGLKTPAARRAAMEAAIGLFIELGLEGTTAGVDWFLVDAVPTPTFGRGIYNEQFQDFYVLDTTVPEFQPLQTQFTVEATQVGGEYLRDHLSSLRDGFTVTDTCGRVPIVNYNGPSFMPVGQVTEIRWNARDAGPKNEDGTGFNIGYFTQEVLVQDTLPPIVVPPAGKVVEATEELAIDIGRPAVFDLADVRPTIVNDAPATYQPNSRTLVTWSATDASGNSTSANQWVTIKEAGTNTTPVANSASVNAISFDPIEIELTGIDNDLISNRYDQLAFSITRPPSNGFFVAPLFPYFIEDRRAENAFGLTRAELSAFLDAQCMADRNYVPDNNFTTEPNYITVTDDDVTYVADTYFRCNRSTGRIERGPRVARFDKDANGDLVTTAVRIDITSVPQQLSIDANGNIYWFFDEGSKTGRSRRCDAMLENCQSFNLDTTPAIGDPTEAHLADVPTSIVADNQEILYATDGNRSLVAYDMTRIDGNSRPAYLGYIAQPGDLPTTGLQRKDMAIDSDGNLYVSDVGTNRVYKFSPSTIVRNDDDTVEFTPGELIGWNGVCNDNLTEVRACDEVQQMSLGYACTAELCGFPTVGLSTPAPGSGPGQFNQPRGIAMDPNNVLYVTDAENLRVQRFTQEGYFAGEAESECDGSCFVLGDFGKPQDVTVNSQFFYVLDRQRDLLHMFETTPITDFDDDTQTPTQTARLTYQSDDGYTGSDSFSFAVHDGLVSSNEADVAISLVRNFRPPIADEGLVFEGEEDTMLDFTLTAFDPDVEDQPSLTFSIESQPANGMITGVGPAFVYTPDPNFFGTETFTFRVQDASGMESEVTEATIEVAAVNDLPTIELAELNDGYGAGFPIRVEAEFADVDLTDRHVYGIDWGPGERYVTGTSLPPGEVAGPEEPTYIQSAPGSAILTHEVTYFDNGPKFVTVCTSDLPGLTQLSSCSDANVTASVTVPFDVETRVSKAITFNDTAPTEVAELDTEVTAPIMDGEQFDLLIAVHNLLPNDTGATLDATDVTLEATLGEGMTAGPGGIIGIAGGATGVTCDFAGRSLSCTVENIPVDGQARVGINVIGDGTVAEDKNVPIVAMVTSAEKDHAGLMIGTSKVYPMTVNPDFDADNDGVINSEDAFPGDPLESSDLDLDGVGDNADPDDDGDSLPDEWEQRFGLNDKDPGDATANDDGDMLTNAMEYEKGTRPDSVDTDRDQRADSTDNCPITANRNQFDQDVDAIGDACDPDAAATVVALGDANGSGGDDYALLRTDGGRYRLYLKDISNDESILADSIDLGVTTDRRFIAAAASTGSIVTLFEQSAEETSRLARRSLADGAFEYDDVVANAGRTAFTLVADGGNVWVLFEDEDGGLEATRYAGVSGTELQDVVIDGNVKARSMAVLNGTLLVLGTDRVSGEPTVLLYDPANDITSSVVVGGPESIASYLAVLADGFAVASQALDGSIDVSTYDADGLPLQSFSLFDSDWTLVDAAAVNELAAIALAAVADDGSIQVQILNAADGSQISTRDFASAAQSFRRLVASRQDVGTLLADSENAVSMEVQAGTGDANIRIVTAESDAPPPPPPPPPPVEPPPVQPGPPAQPPTEGGGGGALGGLLLGLLGCGLVTRRRRSAK